MTTTITNPTPTSANSFREQTENYLRELLLIYFARQRLILSVTATIFLVAAAIAIFASPIYSAQGAILVRSAEVPRTPDALENADLRTFPIEEEDLRSEAELLRSPAVIKGAIEMLVSEHRLAAADIDWVDLYDDLDIKIVPDSRVINVALDSKNPRDAVEILDAILEQYIQRRSQVINPEGRIDFLNSQLKRLASQLGEIERKLAETAAATRTPVPIKEIEANLLTKQRLDEQLSGIKIEENKLREQIRYLDGLLETAEPRLFSSLVNETIVALSERLIDLQMERGKTARYYEDAAGPVTMIDKQIGDTWAQLRREVSDYRNYLQSDLTAIIDQERVLDERIREIESRILNLQQQGFQTEKLSREADVLRESYTTIFRRLQETEINTTVDSAMSLFYVSILNHAYTTGTPIFPNRPQILIVGLLTGLLTGFTLGFMREFFDHSFKIPRDLEQYTGLPLLFSIHLIPETAKSMPIAIAPIHAELGVK